jgi:TonB-linked SusC/RagA family outer membrane protein
MKLKIDYVCKGLLLLFFGVAMSNFAFAQRTIKGVVTDAESGEELIGANILVVGTSIGTITDIDGSYSLNVPAGATQLEFSYTGYTPQILDLGASNVMDVRLSPGSVLDEVVVVGYGTQRVREVTGAVASIKAEDFNAGNVNDPIQLIQGKVAGLSIARVGGDPNGASTLRLRGLSTLGANTAPLVIIDGVIGASLNTVDPTDIASIDVLKDGSAAAIYGTRASSGVIIVTTKRGQAGQTSVEYNTYLAAEQIARAVPVMTAAEFREVRPTQDLGSETNWMDQVTRTALSHVHNLSFSGGVGKTTYRAALNYRDIQGVSIASGFQQLNGRLNLSQKAFNDRLTISLDLSATERNANFGFNEAFRYATTYNPTAPVFLEPGQPLFNRYGGYFQLENFDYFNPLAILEQNFNQGKLKTILTSLRGDYKLADGLVVSAFYSNQRNSDLFGQYYSKESYFRGINRNGLASRFAEERVTQLFESTINYEKAVGKTRMNLLGGYSYQDFFIENISMEAGDFISDAITFNNIGSSLDIARGLASMGSYAEDYKIIAFFGRANFSFDDTYYLSGAVRYEGSSRFGANNRWNPFFSISGGVTLSNLFDVSGIDNLKLRVGYGTTGNLPPASYLSQLLFEPGQRFYYNGEYVASLSPTRNANPDLSWETKGELNAGLDFALFDYKLTGSFDYYNRVTRDLLYEVPVPVPPNLAGRTWGNLEDVVLRNSGVELNIGYLFQKPGSSFSYEPRLLFGTYNTVLDTVSLSDEQRENLNFSFFQSGGRYFDFLTSPGAPGLNNDPSMVVIAGERIGQFFGFQYEGVDEAGNFIYTDVNGDGVIDGQDEIAFGNALPLYSIGLNNTFRYKNFDFNFFLRGDFGHELANMYRVFYEPLGSRPIENLVQTQYFNENLTASPLFNSHYVENASYITLDNITLGYTVQLPAGSSFNRLRFYLTGQNLFVITNYSGVDPTPRYADTGAADNGGRPAREFNPDPLFPGMDRRNTYFRTRGVILGLNVGF